MLYIYRVGIATDERVRPSVNDVADVVQGYADRKAWDDWSYLNDRAVFQRYRLDVFVRKIFAIFPMDASSDSVVDAYCTSFFFIICAWETVDSIKVRDERIDFILTYFSSRLPPECCSTSVDLPYFRLDSISFRLLPE